MRMDEDVYGFFYSWYVFLYSEKENERIKFEGNNKLWESRNSNRSGTKSHTCGKETGKLPCMQKLKC